MLLTLLLSLLFHLNAFAEISNNEKLVQIGEIKTFAFGSCNEQNHEAPIWKQIIKDEVDLFIWGGDNVYANSKNPDRIKESYEIQDGHPDYRELTFKTPIIGTWDDHDFGYDNSRGNFAYKDLSQKYLLDFLHEPFNSPRRFQKGVYTSYTFGLKERRVKFILLDNRYFKDLEPSAPMIGETQWSWLEEQLTSSDAKIHFIMSGLSITSDKIIFSEEWADYPSELNRMLNLIKLKKPKGVVFLSGDKHFASIFRNHGHLEFMSSGMTHTISKGIRKYLGRSYETSFFGLNYGIIKIDWNDNNPKLSLMIRNREGRSVFTRDFTWSSDSSNWKEEPKDSLR